MQVATLISQAHAPSTRPATDWISLSDQLQEHIDQISADHQIDEFVAVGDYPVELTLMLDAARRASSKAQQMDPELHHRWLLSL